MNTRQFALGVVLTFTLILFFNSQTYAFHENLGIDDNKASELYQANPNDPAIVQWKSALQLAINNMDHCFDVSIVRCNSYMSTIINNCKSHPNTLLACNDSRLAEYPLILATAEEAEKKAEEERKKAISNLLPAYAISVIEKCFSNPNSNSTFEVASPSCDTELLSLQRDCQNASSPHDYCKDERFVGYLKKYGIVNSTVPPSSNLTGNSTYP